MFFSFIGTCSLRGRFKIRDIVTERRDLWPGSPANYDRGCPMREFIQGAFVGQCQALGRITPGTLRPIS